MEQALEQKVQTTIVVGGNIKPEYNREQVTAFSGAMDPIVEEFEGYWGRKMGYSEKNSEILSYYTVVYYSNDKLAEAATEKEMQHEKCHVLTSSFDPETVRMWTFSNVSVVNTNPGTPTLFDLFIAHEIEGTSELEIIEASKAVEPILAKLDGHLGRRFGKTDNGEWFDVNYWENPKKLEAAVPTILGNETCKKYYGLFNHDTMTLDQIPITINTEKF